MSLTSLQVRSMDARDLVVELIFFSVSVQKENGEGKRAWISMTFRL